MLNMKGKWLLTFFALVSIVVNTYGQCEPAGGCPNGNCYCISDATVTDRSGTLYDDGGPDRDYKAGEEETAQVINYIFTIEPAGGADTIVLQFPMFDVEFDAIAPMTTCKLLMGQPQLVFIVVLITPV